MKVSRKTLSLWRLRLPGGFTLVEMLTVVLIISILLTMGAIGISRITSGKGVANAVSNSEALFDEARAIAMGKRTTARVLVDKTSPDNANYLRRILVVYQALDAEGKPATPEEWVLSGRGTTLPEGTYFSAAFSKKDHVNSGGQLDEMSLIQNDTVKKDFVGDYWYYEFNEEGLSTTPGASFVVGGGSRPMGQEPRVTGGSKRDFGGFIIWRNGRVSSFRGPDHIEIPATPTTF
jgi:prepilin-type N-terminal cleavage/methylation domain-containing protein